jgi:hypothetical protein
LLRKKTEERVGKKINIIVNLEQNFFTDGSKAIMDIHNVDYAFSSNA